MESAAEWRHGPRRKTIKTATIVFDGGHCTMPCTVLDLSPEGAKLRPSDPMLLPDQFDLHLGDGLVAPCRVVGKRGGDVAVRFQSG